MTDADIRHQTRVGLGLAMLLIGVWICLHVWTVFFVDISFANLPWIIPVILLQCWLYTGLFIIAHDCMHGSLAPFRPNVNRVVGQLCLGLYAGFAFDPLNRAHHRHHRHSGTADDPDFDERPPHGFIAWFLAFFREYFGWREFATIAAIFWIYVLAFGATQANLVMFWALPSLLSALQLFTFGTYLPHKPEATPFTDRHNARSNNFPPWLSLLTCFHFGYHHEHHDVPDAPWWRLPSVRVNAHIDRNAAV
jgi:beta-carotene/zeaxanthin 4-ketolase